ncbi:WecB/TagA/CpsF family glycosyltransferase [Aliihoeflea sp. 40Bstr573]|uniref:WecB/TagA/CpsF family glycosyltransferase n=1 Tax=Aliihoeflea sp. 40Bstr573 TaxID=2696467 RepID=UPI0020959237|nr:WecB/TagA/CpsF family glycosyltransferase [Aliihoeflea sp. 40Bstr573]MCO6388806.1 glycosyltransferase [Aliihoeflea sp. 40Bstr573]
MHGSTETSGIFSVDALAGKARRRFMGTPFDVVTHQAVVRMLSCSEDASPFRYIVTPNVDHVVRLNKNPALLPLYTDAWMSLCDSRPIRLLARLLSLELPLVTGSDLTQSLFRSVVRRGDRVTLIAADGGVVADMAKAFPELRFRSHVPPSRVWSNPAALQECVDFVAQEPARFTLIAIGAPQSEKIASMLACDPRAHGVGLCIGAGLEFLTGRKKRAPALMRVMAIEWLHRLASDPKRLWRRYLYSAMPLLVLFVKEVGGKTGGMGSRPRATSGGSPR